MYALEVQRNGTTLAVVGGEHALMFSADVSAMIEEEAATIDIRGMNDLGSDRKSHTSWLQLAPLSNGDLLAFRFIETAAATAPAKEVATDSEEYLADQAHYKEQLQSNSPTPRELKIKQPNATFELQLTGTECITATLESGREFLSFRVLWNQWHPEHCRVSLSSFSQQEGLARTGGKQWFQGVLRVGEQCVVKVGA